MAPLVALLVLTLTKRETDYMSIKDQSKPTASHMPLSLGYIPL